MKFPSCHGTLGAQDLTTCSLNCTFVTVWEGSKWHSTGHRDGNHCIIHFCSAKLQQECFLTALSAPSKVSQFFKSRKIQQIKGILTKQWKETAPTLWFQVIFLQCSSVGKVKGICTQQQRWGSVVHFPHQSSRLFCFMVYPKWYSWFMAWAVHWRVLREAGHQARGGRRDGEVSLFLKKKGKKKRLII